MKEKLIAMDDNTVKSLLRSSICDWIYLDVERYPSINQSHYSASAFCFS